MSTGPPLPGRHRRWLWTLVGLLAAIAGGIAYTRWPRRLPAPGSIVPPDPRLTFATPFKNVHPDVKYVGDAACATCHKAIVESYRQHPMGQSLYPAGTAPALERHDAAAHNEFEALGLHYAVEQRDGRVIHAELRADEKGVLYEMRAEVAYALGSGRRGRSYLVERDGYLFQSPVSWYTQSARWDLSPGYRTNNLHFERPAAGACLFCHCNHAAEIEHTVNRFERPIFRGHAIGCERCHGPGELHVRNPPGPGDSDDQIVNPCRLSPALREAVCQQCHLQGEARVLRANAHTFDYRPGLPLHLFVSVFVRAPEFADRHKAVGQVEQLAVSACFRESQGRLGCTSCHDPHRVPTAEERVGYFRQRCLQCHEKQGCRLAAEERRRQSADDSCIQCHMPVIGSSIAHTAITDHRIPRRPVEGPTVPPRPLRPGEKPIVHFHRDLVDAGEPGNARDLGIALTIMAGRSEGTPLAGRLTAAARPDLEAAVQAWGADVEAWSALGHIHSMQGRPEEAQRSFEAVLLASPENELALTRLATLSQSQGRSEAARDYWGRAIAVNPFSSQSHAGLAEALGTIGDWRAAQDACRRALTLNPTRVETRKLLVLTLLRLNERARAQAEFERLLRIQPRDRAALQAWFAEQIR